MVEPEPQAAAPIEAADGGSKANVSEVPMADTSPGSDDNMDESCMDNIINVQLLKDWRREHFQAATMSSKYEVDYFCKKCEITEDQLQEWIRKDKAREEQMLLELADARPGRSRAPKRKPLRQPPIDHLAIPDAIQTDDTIAVFWGKRKRHHHCCMHAHPATLRASSRWQSPKGLIHQH